MLDTSALLAVLWNEPERRQLVERIEAATIRLLSVATFFETSSIATSMPTAFMESHRSDESALVSR